MLSVLITVLSLGQNTQYLKLEERFNLAYGSGGSRDSVNGQLTPRQKQYGGEVWAEESHSPLRNQEAERKGGSQGGRQTLRMSSSSNPSHSAMNSSVYDSADE